MNLKKVYIISAALLLLVLGGCSSNSGAGNSEAGKMEPDVFSEQDMAIYKIDNSKERISYGMSRTDAEKVLGAGTEGITNSYTYDSGVSVLYRDDKAVSITLRGETRGIYRTARGAEAGMTRADIKELYGEKYAVENGEVSLEYYYDTTTGQLVAGAAAGMNSLSEEELVDIQLLSTAYDAEGKASYIILMDGKAATTFR